LCGRFGSFPFGGVRGLGSYRCGPYAGYPRHVLFGVHTQVRHVRRDARHIRGGDSCRHVARVVILLARGGDGGHRRFLPAVQVVLEFRRLGRVGDVPGRRRRRGLRREGDFVLGQDLFPLFLLDFTGAPDPREELADIRLEGAVKLDSLVDLAGHLVQAVEGHDQILDGRRSLLHGFGEFALDGAVIGVGVCHRSQDFVLSTQVLLYE